MSAFCTPFIPRLSSGQQKARLVTTTRDIRIHACSKRTESQTQSQSQSQSHEKQPIQSAATVRAMAAASLALAMLSAPLSPSVASETPLNGTPLRWHPQQHPTDTDASSSNENEHGTKALRAQWDLKSADSSLETLLVFANETGRVVDVLWIDYCGREVFYGCLNPGMTHIQQSYVTHPWIVRDHISHNSLLVVTAKADPLLAVVRNA